MSGLSEKDREALGRAVRVSNDDCLHPAGPIVAAVERILTAERDAHAKVRAELDALRAGVAGLAEAGERDGRGNSLDLARRLRALLSDPDVVTDWEVVTDEH